MDCLAGNVLGATSPSSSALSQGRQAPQRLGPQPVRHHLFQRGD